MKSIHAAPANRLVARPTTYRGTPMRSRLEASWAAAFDNHDLPWDYEPRAFADQTGQYLPDFYLPTRDLFVEIKPELSERPSKTSTVPRPPILRRMAIIWSSLPDARLAVFFGGPDDQHVAALRTDSADHKWWWWSRCSAHQESDFYLWTADPSHGSR